VVGRGDGNQVGDTTTVAAACGAEPERAAGRRAEGAATTEATTSARRALTAGQLEGHDHPISGISRADCASYVHHLCEDLVTDWEWSGEDSLQPHRGI
jgi:hypothetical protein